MFKSSRSLKILFLSLLSVLLIACGGGGGGGGGTTPTPTPSGGAPTINFVTSGTITKYYFLGSLSYSNAATSPTNPNSTITYTSSDTSVATVNQFTGAVTILATGTTIITASVTAEGNYTAGSSSYTLVVTNEVPFTAWVGTNDTKVDLPAATSGLLFASTTSTSGYGGGFTYNLNGTQVTDTTAKLNNTAYYWLVNSGQPSDPAVVSQNRFSARKGQELITYQNRLWLIGGFGAGLQNDVWSSLNGEAWKPEYSSPPPFSNGIYDHQLIIDTNAKIRLIGGLIAGSTLNPNIYVGPASTNWGVETTLPGFGKRADHQISTFNGKHWLTGGSTGASSVTTLYTADTYKSTDGLIWTDATPTASFTARKGHQTAEFNGKLWLIGGYNGGYLNDIWSYTETSDTWTQETASATFSARRDHRLIAFNNKLWLIGGESNSTILSDIWSSSDGTTWVQETAAAPFGAVFDHSLAVFNNRLWLAGGQISAGLTYSNEVWSSADGSNWILENSPSEFTGRSNVQATSFLSKLWLFGGESEATNNDIWTSSTAINWAEQSSSTAFTARTNHQIAELNNTLWLSGGQQPNNGANLADTWYSTNGTDWTRKTSSAGIAIRSSHQMLTYDNQLWILGGWQLSNTYLDDVWSSPDGETWTQRTTNGDPLSFGQRSDHQSVAFNNKLWVIGGWDGVLRKNDVWSFITATNTWTQATASAAFSARRKHEVVVFGGKMLLIGGEEFGGGLLNDIWSSTDGVTWTKLATNAEFPARHSHSVVEHGGELYLIGGVDANGKKLKDVWKSSDGISWRRAFGNSIVFQ